MIRLRLVLAMLVVLVFALPQTSHSQESLQKLYSFSSRIWPGMMLKRGPDGNFYGTAIGDDLYFPVARGFVYRLNPSGEFAALHTFPDHRPIGEPMIGEGAVPIDEIVIGRDGTIYGTTRVGGAYGYGVIYSLSLDGTYTVLHEFSEVAHARLQFLDDNGDIYGIKVWYSPERTEYSHIFKLTPDGVLTVEHTFWGWGVPPGTAPGETAPAAIASIVRGQDGKIYGTSMHGGMYGLDKQSGYMQPFGSVFRIGEDGSVEVLLRGDPIRRNFTQIIPAPDGSFYCLSWYAVVRVTPEGAVTTIREFTPAGEIRPAQLVLAPDGNLYGVGFGSGTGQVLFKLTPGGECTILEEVPAEFARAVLAEGNDDHLYAVTAYRWDADISSASVQRTSVERTAVKAQAAKRPRNSFYRKKISDSLAGNRPPVTKADVRTIKRKPNAMPGSIKIPVLINDRDTDKETLTVTALGIPKYGTAEISEDGRNIVYTPGITPHTDFFSYTCTDPRGGTAEGQVLIRRRASGQFRAPLLDSTGKRRGSLFVAMNAYGKFTGNVSLDGKSRKIKGQLSREDSYQTIIPATQGRKAKVQFAMDPSGAQKLKAAVTLVW